MLPHSRGFRARLQCMEFTMGYDQLVRAMVLYYELTLKLSAGVQLSGEQIKVWRALPKAIEVLSAQLGVDRFRG
jgi:hypothetical protein